MRRRLILALLLGEKWHSRHRQKEKRRAEWISHFPDSWTEVRL